MWESCNLYNGVTLERDKRGKRIGNSIIGNLHG